MTQLKMQKMLSLTTQPPRMFSSDVLLEAEKAEDAADAETEMSPLKPVLPDPHVVTNRAIRTLRTQLKIQKLTNQPPRMFSSDVLFEAEKDVDVAEAETEMSPLKPAQLDPHVVTSRAIL